MKSKSMIYVPLLSILVIMLFPGEYIVAEQNNHRGKMEFKLDRLHENVDDSDIRETELEKLFPQLFDRNIKEKINKKQAENNAMQEKTLISLFSHQVTNKEIYSTDTLFDENYISNTSSYDEEEGNESLPISQTTYIISFIILLGVIFSSYIIINKQLSS